MIDLECISTEIAIHLNSNAKLTSVQRKVGKNWEKAPSTKIMPLPRDFKVLTTQTIKVVKVKKNPCYIIVYFAGRQYLIPVKC